tara:strand:+ start:106 stop:405 length:300 start_codon:yes stop_codon:yes gene_type:complete
MKTNWTKQIPWDEVLVTLDVLADAGWEKEAAVSLMAQLLDEALPLDELVPGPAGDALEAIDGPVLKATLGLLWSLAEKKQARQLRKARRAARKAEVALP